jgi:hypothetical protein
LLPSLNLANTPSCSSDPTTRGSQSRSPRTRCGAGSCIVIGLPLLVCSKQSLAWAVSGIAQDVLHQKGRIHLIKSCIQEDSWGWEEGSIPFGYRLMLKSRTLCATAISTPSNVKLDNTRWKIRRLISQIGRRTPSLAITSRNQN